MCRKFETRDTDALERLLSQLGYRVPAGAIEKRVADLRTGAGEVFVKELDGMVVGCVNAIVDTRIAAGLHGEIASLVVLDGYRGRGICKALVLHVEAWLAIRIRANIVREQAHQFYQHVGYREAKTQKVFFKEVRNIANNVVGRNQE